MIDRVWGALRQAGSVARPELLRLLWDAGLLRPESPAAIARALPHLAARGPHLGLAYTLHASAQPSRRALVDARGDLTWKELNDRAIRIGRGFRRRGVQPGERVVLMLEAGRELVECVGAAQKAAAWAVPAPAALTAARIGEILSEQRPRVLVYDSAGSSAVAEAVEGAGPKPALIAVGAGEHARGSSSYEEVVAGGSRQEFRARPVEQPGFVLYPSDGGRGVERDAARGLAAALGFLKAVPLRRRETVLIAAPPWEGLPFAVLALALVLGGTLVLPDGGDAATLLHTIEDERVGTAVVSPDLLARVVGLPAPKLNRSRLGIVLTYAAPVPQDVRRRASNLFGPVIYDVYGTAETGWATVARPEDYDRKPASVGRPVPGVRLYIRAPDGKTLPAGVAGQVCVSSDLAFAGYRGEGGPVPTGDEGWLDDEGYLFLSSRGARLLHPPDPPS